MKNMQDTGGGVLSAVRDCRQISHLILSELIRIN